MLAILEDYHIIHSFTGLVHTLLALLAMGLGTAVLLGKKGTSQHKQIGYLYGGAMLGVNATALGLYQFSEGVNIFHFFAIVSLATLIAGLVPAWRRRKHWLSRHYYFMNWSVVGLYCAFWAEVGVRFFDMRYFWWVVMIASGLTAAIGTYMINRNEPGKGRAEAVGEV